MLDFWRECPNCGLQYFSESLTHCTVCGDELEFKFDKGWLCGHCGEEIEDEWTFCGFCGSEIEREVVTGDDVG